MSTKDSTSTSTIRIEYDDQPTDVIDKTNKALAVLGLRFEPQASGDGWCEFAVTYRGPTSAGGGAPVAVEALADRILERMRGGPLLAVGQARSRDILIEEIGVLVTEVGRLRGIIDKREAEDEDAWFLEHTSNQEDK